MIRLTKTELKHSSCLQNYIDRIGSWKLEEFIEILTRKANDLPYPRILDAGQDWDVELEPYDEGSVEPDMIDFSLYVFCGEDYQLSIDTFLDALSEKYLEELENQSKVFKKSNKYSIGKFKNKRKNGRWEYYSDSEKLISNGNYLDGKRIGEWNIHSPFGKNEKIEIRNYNTYINEIPFFDSYYPNGNIKIKGNHIEDKKYQTTLFRNNGEKSADYYHDLQGQLLESNYYFKKKLFIRRYINSKFENVKETYFQETSKLQYKSVLNKSLNKTLFISYNLDGSIENEKEYIIEK